MKLAGRIPVFIFFIHFWLPLPVFCTPGSFEVCFADSGNGTALVRQYIVPEQIHFTSLPVEQVNISTFQNFSALRYDEPTHSWCEISALPDTLIDLPMAGYSLLSTTYNPDSTTISFMGKPNTGPKSITLSRTWDGSANPPDFDGWNLVGNPYPSAIDWISDGWVLGNIDPVIYLFDGVNYKPLNRNNLLGNGSRFIPAMQGFFVHVTSGGAGSLGLENTCRVHNNQAYYKGVPRIGDLLVIDAYIDSLSDRVYIHFNPSSTDGFDTEEDAYKLFGIEKAPQLYCVLQDQKLVSVNVLPYAGSNTVVPLSFRTGSPDSATLIASNLESFPDGTTLYLEDLKTGFWHNLFENNVYPFFFNSGDSYDRFLLHFNDPTAGNTGSWIKANEPVIRGFGKTVSLTSGSGEPLTGNLLVYDILGKRLIMKPLSEVTSYTLQIQVSQGIYIVAFVSDSGVYVKKIILE